MIKQRMHQIFLVLILIFSVNAISAVETTRPNILFILADDLGYSDVGFNQLPGTTIDDIVTPNIDKLAEDGTVFTSAYSVHVFCGPSRAGLLTGRYPHVFGSQFNLAAFSEGGVDTSETYMSKVLQDAGYYTGIMGKWHLGEEEQFQPNNRGFDEFFGFLGGGHKYFSDDYLSISATENAMANAADGSFTEYSVALLHNKEYVTLTGNQYLTDVLTNQGLSFLEKAKQGTKPFFLFMSYNAPHTLLEAKAEDIATLKADPYNITFKTEDRATYSAMMYALDKQIKVLIDGLKAKGLYDNTLIVFMSDNGGKGPDETKPNSPLKGRKGDVYEGGYRVPMFMLWPAGMASAPKKYDFVVSGLDLYPTFVNLAGATLPNGKILDGNDIFDAVNNNTDTRSDESLFALRVASPNNNIAARKGKWKAIKVGTAAWQLYDLENDIEENSKVTNNPTKLKELMDDAYGWVKTHKDPLWFDSPTYNFEDKWVAGNMPNWERTFPGYDFTSVNSIWADETAVCSVYPNPANALVNFNFGSSIDSTVDVYFYDLNGKVVQIMTMVPQQTTNSISIDLDHNLANGMYLVKINSGDQIYSTKVQIKR